MRCKLKDTDRAKSHGSIEGMPSPALVEEVCKPGYKAHALKPDINGKCKSASIQYILQFKQSTKLQNFLKTSYKAFIMWRQQVQKGKITNCLSPQ